MEGTAPFFVVVVAVLVAVAAVVWTLLKQSLLSRRRCLKEAKSRAMTSWSYDLVFFP